MNRRILVVEDDAAIRRGVVDAMHFAGYEVIEAPDGDEGFRAATRAGYDLMLLDLVLPGKQGMEILAEVRLTRPAVPVIILTAKGDEPDRVKGLKLGADDYVVKPFSIKELLARVEAVLRRSGERAPDLKTVRFEGGEVDFARAEARLRDGSVESLSEREVELLRYLAINQGRVISRDELLRRVWRLDPEQVMTRTVDMNMTRLREKLKDDPDDGKIIRTVRGRGYLFVGKR